MDSIEQAVKDYIVKEFLFDKPGQHLESDDPLIASDIIDSLGIFMLVAFLVKRFGVEVQPDDLILENFETVNAIKRLVEVRRSSKVQTTRETTQDMVPQRPRAGNSR
jgi:acyl carrier protein